MIFLFYHLTFWCPTNYTRSSTHNELHYYGYYTIHYDWNYSKDVIVSYQNDKLGFVDYQSKEVIPHQYDSFIPIEDFNNSHIILSKNNKYGVIDSRTGKTKIEFEYEKIDLINSKYNIYIADTTTGSFLLDQSENVLLDLSEHSIERQSFDGTYLVCSKNGLYGIYNVESKEILLQPIF